MSESNRDDSADQPAATEQGGPDGDHGGAPSDGTAPFDGTAPSSGMVSEKKPAPTMRLGWIAFVVAICIAAIAQYFAPSFDHQNANLIALASISMATLYFLFCLHRVDRHQDHPWRVPVAAAGVLVVFAILFQPDGFSGEMLPRFRFRFAAEKQHELKSITASEQLPQSEEVTRESTVDFETIANQFLGPQRNGVYPKRAFDVPETPSDVKVVWDHGIGAAWSSFAVSGDLALTLEQRDDTECLSCYRLTDGELLWMRLHRGLHENHLGGVGPRSTPTILENQVYATTATGHLWCVSLETTEVVWEVDLLKLAGWDKDTFETAAPWGYACSPLLVDGLCVVTLGGPVEGSDSASLIAFDAASGAERWRSGDDQLSYASPTLLTLDGQRQIVSVNEKTVTGHAIDDGKQLWSFSWPGSTNTGANCSSALQVGTNQVLVGKGYGGGSALVEISRNESSWQTEDVWRSHRVLKTKFNHTAVDGSVGYAINNGSLQAVNLPDGTTYWTQPRRRRAAQGQAVLVEDVIVLQDEEGDLVFVDADTDGYNELLRVPALDSKTWNIPTVAGRYVLVRNDRQAICFEMPPRS